MRWWAHLRYLYQNLVSFEWTVIWLKDIIFGLQWLSNDPSKFGDSDLQFRCVARQLSEKLHEVVHFRWIATVTGCIFLFTVSTQYSTLAFHHARLSLRLQVDEQMMVYTLLRSLRSSANFLYAPSLFAYDLVF